MAVTYDPIATTTLTSTASSITFSSISSAYTDLRLVFVPIANNIVNQLVLNSDTGSNYSRIYIRSDGTTAASNYNTNQTLARLNTLSAPATSGNNGFYTIDIFSYGASTYKTMLMTSSQDNNGSGAVERMVNLWRSTSAVTSITLSPNSGTYGIGTIATLYGIKAA